jgi:hypothetical protein
LARVVDGRIDLVGNVTFQDEDFLTWRPCDVTPTPLADPTTVSLSDSLFDLDNLGIGWVEWPASSCDEGESTTCFSIDEDVPQASTRFIGPRNTVLAMDAAFIPSGADEWLQSLRDIPWEGETCDISYPDGKIDVHFVPVNGAPFGDEVVAWKTYFDGAQPAGRAGGSPLDYARVNVAFVEGDAIGVVWGHFYGEPYVPPDQRVAPDSLDETTIESVKPLLEMARRKLHAVEAR